MDINDKVEKYLSESIEFSKDNIKSALYSDLNKMLDQMKGLNRDIEVAGDKEDWDLEKKLNNKYNRLSIKAKREFKRTGITGVDFYGYQDTYYSTK